MQLFGKGDTVWGAGVKNFDFGPWGLHLWLEAKSDICNQKECGLWVSLTKRVWLYVMVTSRSTKLAVFDAGEFGITMENYKNFGKSSLKDTLEELGSSVKAVFSHVGTCWISEPLPTGVTKSVNHLDKKPIPQGTK